ncbi:MAG: hypothetical protein KBD90_00895 [Alphaproteobacteria bacterium]|nr:hypothetical protein [Alphaproteobacteria bacterium]
MIILNRTLFASTLYLSMLFCTALWAMDQDNIEERFRPQILPINVEQCEQMADGIRKNDQLSDLEAERLNGLNRLQFQNLAFRPEEDTPEILEEEESKLQEKIRREELERIKMEERFLDLEQNIFTKALRILPQEMKAHYKYLVRGKKIPPSQAILELTKDIDTQPRALELLALIQNYDEYVSMYCFNRDVGEEATLRLYSYYLEKYNERTKELPDSNQMNVGVHELLQLCQRHTPTNPMTGIDDPECSLMHISQAVNQQLRNLKLWYLDNPTLVRKLPATDDFLRLFTLGIRLLECTTYGLYDEYFDLAYMLKLKGFKGEKEPLRTKDEEKDKQFQHIWVHPHMPLQVRITQNGKLTVGLVKKIPFRESGQIDKRLISGEKLNEFYKISNSSVGYVIPARFKNKNLNELWSKEAKENEKGELMNEAHPILNQGYMNFDKVTEILHPEPEEGLPKYQSKKNEKSKKSKKPKKPTNPKKKK